MDYHHHARLTIHSREQLTKQVLAGELSLNSAAAEFKLSRQSVAKWVRRYREGGSAAPNPLAPPVAQGGGDGEPFSSWPGSCSRGCREEAAD